MSVAPTNVNAYSISALAVKAIPSFAKRNSLSVK